MIHLISSAAGRHNELSKEIAALDYAELAFAETAPRLQDLLVKQKCLASELGWATEKMEMAKAAHLQIKHSVTNKWSSKLTGRGDQFREMAVKEERQYMDSLEDERKAQVAYDAVNSDIEELLIERKRLKQTYERRSHFQRELNDLYDQVFSGSAFPTERNIKAELLNTQDADSRAQSALSFELETLNLLDRAQASLCGSRANIDEALDENKWDIVGWSNSDIWETQMLVSARRGIQDFQSYFHQAQQMNTAVRTIQRPNLPQWSATEVILDNPVADLAMHNRYKAAVASLAQTQLEMEAVCDEARQRVAGAKLQAVRTTEYMVKIRHDLYECRTAIFMDVMSGGSSAAQKPLTSSVTLNPRPSLPSTRGSFSILNTPSDIPNGEAEAPRISNKIPVNSAPHSITCQPRPGLPSRPYPRPLRSSPTAVLRVTEGPNEPSSIPASYHASPPGPPPGHPDGQTRYMHMPPPGPPPNFSSPSWGTHHAPPAGPPPSFPPQAYHAPPLGPPPGFTTHTVPHSISHPQALQMSSYPLQQQPALPPSAPPTQSFRQKMALDLAWIVS